MVAEYSIICSLKLIFILINWIKYAFSTSRNLLFVIKHLPRGSTVIKIICKVIRYLNLLINKLIRL